MKDFFKKLYNKLFHKNLLAPAEKNENDNVIEGYNKKKDFSYELKRMTNPDICDGNGYGIKRINDIKELI